MPTTVIDGLEISWDERVLEPRPWTRWQSRWAVELDPGLPPGPLIDLCTGVGQIGLLAARDTGRRAFLVDADRVACRHARRNVRRAGLQGGVRVIRHVIDGHQIPAVPLRVPLVLADPPYVPRAAVDPSWSDPARAVDGGTDGLDLVPRVLRSARAHLSHDGVVLLQVRGARQAMTVSTRLSREWADLDLVPTAQAIFGPDRAVLLLRRRSGRSRGAHQRTGRG